MTMKENKQVLLDYTFIKLLMLDEKEIMDYQIVMIYRYSFK
jgi:hypothetical protein